MGFFSYLCTLLSRSTPNPDCLIFETIGPEPEHFEYCDIKVIRYSNKLAQYNDFHAPSRSDSGVVLRMPSPELSSPLLHSNTGDLSIDSYDSTTSSMDATETVSGTKATQRSCNGMDIRDFAYPRTSPLHAPATEQPDSGRFRWVKMYKKGASWKRWMTSRMIDEFKSMGYGVVYIGNDADEEERAERRKRRLEGFKEAMTSM